MRSALAQTERTVTPGTEFSTAVIERSTTRRHATGAVMIDVPTISRTIRTLLASLTSAGPNRRPNVRASAAALHNRTKRRRLQALVGQQLPPPLLQTRS